ncbi:MAG TPA: alkane 1-monooxygenase [Methyloceanibacter sp.]|nr:alkane 1-monooxygenase [Methyloceanibacter sp.]
MTTDTDSANRLARAEPGDSSARKEDAAKPSLFQRDGLLATWRYMSANVLLVLGAASLVVGGYAPFAVIAVAMAVASFADEAGGDDDTTLSDRARAFCNFNLYLSLPLMCLLAVLLVRFAAERPNPIDWPLEWIGALWVTGYLFALVGATVAHELTHRPGKMAHLVAQILLGFTGNSSFAIYHVYVHHRQVGTYDDASTARRDERLRTFVARALVQQFTQAAQVEAARLRRKGLPVWSRHNRLIQAHLAPLSILVLALIIGGPAGLLAIVLAGLLGRLFHELINFVQHFGLVRVENTPIRPHHSWDCYRTISNVLHYNLPRHSDHHMFATKPFWHLSASDRAPMLPYGYQTMAFIALTPPLWRAIMRPLLVDWDKTYASEAELDLVRERGWENLA